MILKERMCVEGSGRREKEEEEEKGNLGGNGTYAMLQQRLQIETTSAHFDMCFWYLNFGVVLILVCLCVR